MNRLFHKLIPTGFALEKRALLGFACLFIPFCLFAASPKFAGISELLNPGTNVSNSKQTPAHDGQTVTNSSGRSSTNSMEMLDDKYLLAIDDRISFRIAEDEEDPKSLRVTDSGDLEVPYLGRYPAVGRTCKQLARELKTELEKEYYYHADVTIAVDLRTRSRGKIYLVGAVRAPGPEDVPSDEVLTLSKAVLRAGGFTDFADKKNVKITRKSATAGAVEETFSVDVGKILEKGKMDTDVQLQPGDLIYVPERLIRF